MLSFGATYVMPCLSIVFARTLRFLWLALIAIGSAAILTACQTRITEPKDCESAQLCAEVVTMIDPSCKVPLHYSSDKIFAMHNRHPNRKLYVTYEAYVRHVSSVKPDEKVIKMVAVDPRKTETLGCWRTKGVLHDNFDEWSYTITTACFANECPSPPISKPSETREPGAKCEELCARDDASCLKSEIGAPAPIGPKIRSALYRFTSAHLNNPLPTSINMEPITELANAFTQTNSCWRGNIEIGASSPITSAFRNSGSACRIPFDTSDPRAPGLEVAFQGDWTGQFERTKLSYKYVSSDEAHSPMMSIEKRDGKVVHEAITTITGEQGLMTFTGSKYYCGQIYWRGD